MRVDGNARSGDTEPSLDGPDQRHGNDGICLISILSGNPHLGFILLTKLSGQSSTRLSRNVISLFCFRAIRDDVDIFFIFTNDLTYFDDIA